MKDEGTVEYRLRKDPEREGWYWAASDDSACYGPHDTVEDAANDFWDQGDGEEIFNDIKSEGESEGLTKEEFLADWDYITRMSSWPVSSDIFDADIILQDFEEHNEEAVWGEAEPVWPKGAKRELEQMLGQALYDWVEKHNLWREFRSLQ